MNGTLTFEQVNEMSDAFAAYLRDDCPEPGEHTKDCPFTDRGASSAPTGSGS